MTTGSAEAKDLAITPTFDQFSLAPFLQKTIAKIGFTQPTPIQRDAIPTILDGKDIMGLAQTGTGKTVAFVLPLVQQIVSNKTKAIQALILTPTRELAEQVNDVVRQFTPRTGVRSTTIYGGVSHKSQITQLNNQPQIIVACPGRLLDHISAKTIDLTEVKYLVLDEADRMLDMGFMPDIKKIIETLPKKRQTLLFSATMPAEIEDLSEQILNKPQVIRVKTDQPVALVEHAMFAVKKDAKLDRLINLMKVQTDSVSVVFTKMKFTAKRLGDQLTKAGVAAVALHGNLSQAQRKRALQGFRDGKFRVLLATDIASRGIDIQGITHVVNYDMPDTLEAYIHRTGRVGRASNKGEAISFVMRSDRDILRAVEKWLGHPLSKLNADELTEEDMSEKQSVKKAKQSTAPKRENGERRRDTKPKSTPNRGRGTGRNADSYRGRNHSEGSEDDRPRRRRPQSSSESERRSYNRRDDDGYRGRGRSQGRDDDKPRGRRNESRADNDRASFRGKRPTQNRQKRDFDRNNGEGGFKRNTGQRSHSKSNPLRAKNSDRQRSVGNRRPKSFRGQQDIDPSAEYVYREAKPVFIDRFDDDKRSTKRPKPNRQGAGEGRRRQGSSGAAKDGARRGARSGSRGPSRSKPRAGNTGRTRQSRAPRASGNS